MGLKFIVGKQGNPQGGILSDPEKKFNTVDRVTPLELFPIVQISMYEYTYHTKIPFWH